MLISLFCVIFPVLNFKRMFWKCVSATLECVKNCFFYTFRLWNMSVKQWAFLGPPLVKGKVLQYSTCEFYCKLLDDLWTLHVLFDFFSDRLVGMRFLTISNWNINTIVKVFQQWNRLITVVVQNGYFHDKLNFDFSYKSHNSLYWNIRNSNISS